MPGVEIEAYTRASGSIWSRLINRKMDVASQEISKQLAEKGKEMVEGHLEQVIVNPTPYYQTQIRTEPQGVFYRVSDSGVVYGGWLEGIDGRNKPRPGFPGYHTFRIVKGQLENEAPRIARVIVHEYTL